jgi:hypothetical protein
MKKKGGKRTPRKPLQQYTIRGIPQEVDHVLRETAKITGISLNETALNILSEAALKAGARPVKYRDLSKLAGKWKEDPEFDKALAAQRVVDPRDWR